MTTNSDIIRVRVDIGGNNATALTNLKIQYSTDNSSFTDMGAGNAWNWASCGVADGGTVAGLLLSTTNVNGEYIESSGNSPSHSATNHDEWDFCIKPTATVSASTLYYFRLNFSGSPIGSGSGKTHPQITTAAATVVTPALCTRRVSLTIDHTKVLETGYYPVLFDGSGDSGSFGTRLPDELFTLSQADGGDIAFASDSAGANQLPVEVVSFTPASKKAEIWVKVNLASLSSDTVIYVFYESNSGTLTQPTAGSTYGSQNVWDSNYVDVFHLPNGTTLTANDSTSNGYNGTLQNSPGAVAGKIDGAGNFDGVDSTGKHITFPKTGLPTGSSQRTMEIWFKLGAVTGGYAADGSMLAYGDNSNMNRANLYYAYNGGSERLYIEVAGNGYGYFAWSADTNWHKFVATFPAGQTTSDHWSLYLDGNPQSVTFPSPLTMNTTQNNSGDLPAIGAIHANTDSSADSFYGYLDEARISNSARSANYIKTDFYIQSSTSLVTVGTPGNNVTGPYACQSTKSGNWSDATVWTNCNSTTPQTADTAEIMSGHTVTLDTAPTVAGLTVDSTGTFNPSTYLTTISGTFSVTGTIDVGASTFAGNYSQTPTLNSGSTVNYEAAAGSQTVLSATYYTLTLSNTSGTDTAAGALTVNTALTTTSGGTLAMSTFQLLGAFTPTNNGAITTSNTTDPAIPTGKTWTGTTGAVTFAVAGGGQYVPAGTYGTLNFSNTSGIDTADGNLSITTLTTTAGGTLNMGATSLISAVTTATGSAGIIKTSVPTATSAVPIPTGISWGGTVEYGAVAGVQTVMAGTYTTLTLDNTSATDTASGAITATTLNTTASGTLNMVTYDLGVTSVTNSGTIRTQDTGATPLTTGKTWAGTITYDATTGGQTIMAGAYATLNLSNTSGTDTLSGAITIAGNLAISTGTLDDSSGNNYAISVAGNWTNSGTFTARSGTVTLTSGTHTISGNTTFYNLTVNASNTVTFVHGTTTTVSSFIATGSAGNTITINSDTSAYATLLNNTNNVTVHYASITNNHATGSATWTATDNCTNGGGNSGWTFGATSTSTKITTGVKVGGGIIIR